MELDSASLSCVFNVLDTDKKGYITVNQFTSAFEHFYNTSVPNTSKKRPSFTCQPTLDVQNIVEVLDPQHDGLISFEDFQSVFRDYFSCDDSEDLKNKGAVIFNLKGRQYSIVRDDHDNSISQDFDADNTEDSGINFASVYDFKPPQETLTAANSSTLLPHHASSKVQKSGANLSFSYDVASSPFSVCRSDYLDDEDSSFKVMRAQLRRMQEHVEKFTTSTDKTSEHETVSRRLREENARLTALAFVLEERLKEAEARSERSRESDQSQMQSLMTRTQRLHDSEVENLHTRLQKLENDLSESSQALCRMKMDADMLMTDKKAALEELAKAEEQISFLQNKLNSRSSSEDTEIAKILAERDSALITLNEVQSALVGDENGRYRVHQQPMDTTNRLEEMHQIIRILKENNKKLLIQLSEAQDELLARSIEDGRALLLTGETSLASELDTLTKNEISDLLTSERHTSNQLRDYIRHLVDKVIQFHPDLLQIAHS